MFHQLSNSEYQTSGLVFLIAFWEVTLTCFHPLTAYRSNEFNRETGKYGCTFNPTKALIEGSSFKLPCGQCRGCRFDKAQHWAIRCAHEAQMHDRCCFLTLTYEDGNLPVDYSVKKRELQLFNMRVQKAFGRGKRYFGVGEYGEQDGRPHYHELGFGFDFSEDRKLHAVRDGFNVWRSAKLEELWPFGFSEIGSLTPQSAGYVARYCMKKITGDLSREHYLRPSPVDGKMHTVEPEFALMSRRPGIGATWFDRYKSDCFPSDFVIVDGRKKPVPRYYVSKLAEIEAKFVKRERLRKDLKDLEARRRRRADKTRERLAVRESVFASKLSRLGRGSGQ